MVRRVGQSLREFASVTIKHLWWLVVSLVGGVWWAAQFFAPTVGATGLQRFLDHFPGWVPPAVFVVGLTLAAFRAFHEVRLERDELKARVKTLDSQRFVPGVNIASGANIGVINVQLGEAQAAPLGARATYSQLPRPAAHSNRYVKNQIRIPEDIDLVAGHAIADTHFEECEILGPAVLVPQGETRISDPIFVTPDLEAILWEIPTSRQQILGAYQVIDCTFIRCRFVEIGLAGPPEAIQKIRAAYKGVAG
jgi:hypothetical protein